MSVSFTVLGFSSRIVENFTDAPGREKAIEGYQET